MAKIKTKWQAKRIRQGILLARGETALTLLGGFKIDVKTTPEELDLVMMNFAHKLNRKAYFTVRILEGDPHV